MQAVLRIQGFGFCLWLMAAARISKGGARLSTINPVVIRDFVSPGERIRYRQGYLRPGSREGLEPGAASEHILTGRGTRAALTPVHDGRCPPRRAVEQGGGGRRKA